MLGSPQPRALGFLNSVDPLVSASDGGESCIVLESGPTRSLVAKLPQLVVREFRAAGEERCKQGYGRMCAKL